MKQFVRFVIFFHKFMSAVILIKNDGAKGASLHNV